MHMLPLLGLALSGSLATPDFTADLDELTQSLPAFGAYVTADGVNFAALAAHYRSGFRAAKSKDELLPILERYVGELRDHHSSLGSNTSASPRLVPSGTDLLGEWRQGKVVISQVRPNSVAARADIRPGDVITEIQGLPVRQACTRWFGVRKHDERGWNWALNSALAGTWDTKRRITLSSGRVRKTVEIDTAQTTKLKSVLTVQQLDKGILYLRPEDSLGQDDLITAFDKALPACHQAKGIIIDLRNTPSGGSSSVARGIMGNFIGKRLPFQRHRAEEQATRTVRDWTEYASPRSPKPATARMVVLVNGWTGSMGEGIAIGFDGMKRATVIGPRMAGLRGGVDSLTLPVSGLRVFFPTEQIFHINGTPRHDWIPPIPVVAEAGDAALRQAIRLLRPRG